MGRYLIFVWAVNTSCHYLVQIEALQAAQPLLRSPAEVPVLVPNHSEWQKDVRSVGLSLGSILMQCHTGDNYLLSVPAVNRMDLSPLIQRALFNIHSISKKLLSLNELFINKYMDLFFLMAEG